MCVDYRALNHNTVKFAYPMPRIEQLLESLKDYTVVRKLDLAEGFHQIRMDPNDIVMNNGILATTRLQRERERATCQTR